MAQRLGALRQGTSRPDIFGQHLAKRLGQRDLYRLQRRERCQHRPECFANGLEHAHPASLLRWSGWAMAISALRRSSNDRSRKDAMPNSVTTTSATEAGNVAGPLRRATMRDRPLGACEASALVARPLRWPQAGLGKLGTPATAP